jgi:uncharacterized RDD family membrane protein YckC
LTVVEQESRDAQPVPGEVTDWPVADLQRRFLALMADWILCLLVGRLLGPGAESWGAPFVLVVEYAFFVGVFGQTPGMRLLKVACVSIVDGKPIGIPRALLRGVLLAPLVPALIMDRQRRGLHDRAAGSIVVDSRSAAPSP